MTGNKICLSAAAITTAMAFGNGAMAQVPAAVAVPGATTLATYQGVGAQVYECKAGSDGKLTWTFREPIATLILNGKTVGRHYAGPTRENVDSSMVVAKARATRRAPQPIIFPGLNSMSSAIRAEACSPGQPQCSASTRMGVYLRAPAVKLATSRASPTPPRM